MQHMLLTVLGSLLLGAVALAPVPPSSDEVCTAATCGAASGDDPSLLQQHIARRASALAQDAPPQVPCNGDLPIPQGSNSGNACSGDMCCPEYSWTYPCPSASEAFKASGGCVLDAMQQWPDGESYSVPPESASPTVVGAYGPVSMLAEPSTADYLRSIPGIAEAVELREGEPGYREAFYPPVVEDDSYYTGRAYPGIWGDLGSVMQPGFGGLMTYSVFNITPSASEPISLYRVTSWASTASYMCGIWWGFESSYNTTVVEAATNIQICSEPSAIVQCNITEPITVIVGQGWNLDSSGFMERNCTNAAGEVEPPDNFVASRLIEQNFPPPPADKLQIVVPGCQLAGLMASQCRACPLPQEGLESVQDVASYANPADQSSCKTGLLTPSYENSLRKVNTDMMHR